MFNLEKPRNDFARVRDGRESMPLWMDVDLSTSRSITGTGANAALSLNVSGNSFFVDADNTNVGNAVIHFQDTSLGISSAPFYAAPGFVASVPFTQILIENAAQPGKRLRIFYGVDLDFRAGVNASVISGSVSVTNPLTVRPEQYNGTYVSEAALAINTAQQIIAPGANVNGVLLLNAGFNEYNSVSLPRVKFLAKNSAPANTTDGVVVLSPSSALAGVIAFGQLNSPLIIPAGLGLYVISDVITVSYGRHALYKTL